MRLTPGLIAMIAFSAAPAIISFVVLAFLARMRRAQLWYIPGWLAAAALGPAFSTFFAIRLVISAFQGLAETGGGIGAVSAGMWEATQPILFSLYVSSVLTVLAFIIGIRALVSTDEEEAAQSDHKGTFVSLSLLVIAAVGAVATLGLFQNVTSIVIRVIDPKAPPLPGGIADVSTMIAARILATSGTSVVTTLVLLAGIGVLVGVQPGRPPSAALARFFVFAALVAILASAGSALVMHSSAKRFYNAALTGQLSP